MCRLHLRWSQFEVGQIRLWICWSFSFFASFCLLEDGSCTRLEYMWTAETQVCTRSFSYLFARNKGKMFFQSTYFWLLFICFVFSEFKWMRVCVCVCEGWSWSQKCTKNLCLTIAFIKWNSCDQIIPFVSYLGPKTIDFDNESHHYWQRPLGLKTKHIQFVSKEHLLSNQIMYTVTVVLRKGKGMCGFAHNDFFQADGCVCECVERMRLFLVWWVDKSFGFSKSNGPICVHVKSTLRRIAQWALLMLTN